MDRKVVSSSAGQQGVPSVPWLPRTASINTGTRTVLAEHHTLQNAMRVERGTILIRLDGNCNAILCNVFKFRGPPSLVHVMYNNSTIHQSIEYYESIITCSLRPTSQFGLGGHATVNALVLPRLTKSSNRNLFYDV